MTNCIKTILDLEDQNITFTNKAEKMVIRKQMSYVFYAKLSYTPTCCEHCHTCYDKHIIVKNGTRQSRLSLISISGLPAYLLLDKQRFFCRACHKSFTAKTPIVPKHAFITNRLRLFIDNQLSDTVSETYIAKQNHVSVHTVRRITDDIATHLVNRPHHTLPEHLCFDEFKSVKSSDSAMSFVYCDAITHQLIDIVEDRKLTSLKDYFLRFDLKNRQTVKTVCIDFYPPYIELIKEQFSHAKIVIDPFHIVQHLLRELSRYRVQFMNSKRTKEPLLYRKLKRYARLLLANPDKLIYGEYRRFRCFTELTNTSNIVDYLLDKDILLKNTYRIVHQLVETINNRDYSTFEEILNTSVLLKLPKGLKRVIRTLKKYKDYIHNTCEYRQISNGPIEGLNNKIKVLKRNAYGYRNFDHFKKRILLMTRLYKAV